MNSVKVLPFVGHNYQRETLWGLEIMILGESHYSDETLCSEFTREVVREMLGGPSKRWMNFFNRTVGVFHGGWCPKETRTRFWSSSIFYNYIQETVGAQSRIRPTQEMWAKAAPAFEEVLIHLQPRFVLVLGKELWSNLPVTLIPGPLVTLPDGQAKESRLYFNDAGYSFIFGIAHPSSFGWSYKKWTPWVEAALQVAIQFQRGSESSPQPWT
jgi:hypothetical protein